MTVTIQSLMVGEATETTSCKEAAGLNSTERLLPARDIPLGLEATRVRLAQELFGVALAVPKIGRFHVLEKLGEGTMGEVYAAFDPELDRRVAIKVLHADQDESQDRRLRLIREAQALARVSHPNVVQVFEVGLHRDRVFVAMEHVRGESLAQKLAHPPDRNSWASTLQMFIAAGRGLAAVHAAGLVHRDFKPANTIVGEDGRVRVLDFGLARGTAPETHVATPTGGSRSDGLDATLTAIGSVVGTPAYMAPELLLGQRADYRSDQYSYCTALYEALYGVRPHTGETLAGLAEAKLVGAVAPAPPGSRVPAWLHAVMVRGLSVVPDRRWPSIPALLAELERDRHATLRRWAVGAVAVVVLAVIAVSAHQVREQQRITADERGRAETAERDAAAQQEQVRRAVFERSVMAEAEQAAEVMRLARTMGRERDALVLGVQTLSRYAPDFGSAPLVAIDGLAAALPAMIPARTIPASGQRIVALALSDDGQRLATAGAGGQLRLWNATDGTPTVSTTYSGDEGSLKFSPDGAALLFQNDGCTIYDANTGAVGRALASCRYARFASDGEVILGGALGGDGKPRITAWNTSRDGERWSVAVPAAVEALEVAPRGDMLAVSLGNGLVQIRDTDDGHLRTTLRPPTPLKRPLDPALPQFATLGFSNDGERLAVASDWGLHLWQVTTRSHIATVIQAQSEWGSVKLLFTRDDEKLLVVSPLLLRVFDAASGAAMSVNPSASLTDPGMLTDGTILATEHSGRLSRWSDEGALIDSTRADVPGFMWVPFALSANRVRAATGRDGIRLWNLGDPRAVAQWVPPANHRALLPAGSRVVTETSEHILHLRDRSTGTVLAGPFQESVADTTDEAALRLHAVHLFADKLWSRRGDHVRVHDLRDGRMVSSQHRTWAASTDSWLAPLDSPRLAFVTVEGTVEVFDAATAARRCAITGEGEQFRGGPARFWPNSKGIVLSRDGRRLAVPVGESNFRGLVDGITGALQITTWSTDTCEPLTVITIPHQGRSPDVLHDLAFAVDGSLVTRLGATTFVHDPQSGRERFRADDPCASEHILPEGISELSPDGTRLLTVCNGSAQIWSLDGDELGAVGIEIGRVHHYPYAGLIAGRPWSFFADSERVLLPDDQGGHFVWDIDSASPSIRLSARGLTSQPAAVALDGEYIEHHGHHDQLVTHDSTRRSMFTAACRALAGTEVWEEVVSECSAVSP